MKILNSEYEIYLNLKQKCPWKQIGIPCNSKDYGITCHYQTDGSIHAFGIGQDNGPYLFGDRKTPPSAFYYQLIPTHKYCTLTTLSSLTGDYNVITQILIEASDGRHYTSYSGSAIWTCNNSSSIEIYAFYVNAWLWVSDNTEIDVTFWTMIFDLTDMYGEGREPTSVEDFKKDFPLKYYGYNL